MNTQHTPIKRGGVGSDDFKKLVIKNSYVDKSLFIKDVKRIKSVNAKMQGVGNHYRKMDHNNPKILTAKKMQAEHNMCVHDIYRTLQISRTSLYRYLGLAKKHGKQ